MNSFNLNEFLPYQFAVAAEGLSEAFSKHYREQHGISRAEWRIICHLGRTQAGLSIRDLQKEIHLEKSKTSRAVSRMEARGILKKSTDEKDARLIAIVLTEKGHGIYRALVPVAQKFQRQLEEKFTDEELAVLRKALTNLHKV